MLDKKGERMMKTLAKCPICDEEVPTSDLETHVKEDNKEIRDYIISSIRNHNPEWVASDGTCDKCWAYYRKL